MPALFSSLRLFELTIFFVPLFSFISNSSNLFELNLFVIVFFCLSFLERAFRVIQCLGGEIDCVLIRVIITYSSTRVAVGLPLNNLCGDCEQHGAQVFDYIVVWQMDLQRIGNNNKLLRSLMHLRHVSRWMIKCKGRDMEIVDIYIYMGKRW